MSEGSIEYRDGSEVCEGVLALPKDASGPRPCLLVAHQWAGLTDHEVEAAKSAADHGYVGFAIDVYGKGRRGSPTADNSALMQPWLADRAKLRDRLLAAVAAAAAHERVDPARIAVLGYCFGGLCALDLARSGDPRVKAAISVHGVFAPSGIEPKAKITASVLVLHGYEDPLAKPAEMLSLADELTSAGADWQIHAYGHAKHAFTAEGANNPAMGLKYDPKAAARSRAAAAGFLKEVFGA